MLTRYIRAAMALAKYEIVEEDATFYGSIAAARFRWDLGQRRNIGGMP